MGDCVINTNFPLLVENTVELPAIQCAQRKAPKCVPTEEDIVNSNIKSFGNAVGAITNKITSMFEVQARFAPDSREYRILDYRIKCGQLYQQNSIDAAKGIEAKPMPDKWYSWIANKISKGKDSAEKKQHWENRKIVADKKPYFMQYIYPAERKRLLDYMKSNDQKCVMNFRISLNDLLQKHDRTEEEENFVRYYYERFPLGLAPCTINKICWKIENMFDVKDKIDDAPFDYSILKSDAEYPAWMFQKIKCLYKEYTKEVSDFMTFTQQERIKDSERIMHHMLLRNAFWKKCESICPDEDVLCNIVLDICYPQSGKSKQFAWDMCGDVIIKNLLKRNNYIVHYPTLDENGDIYFKGERFRMETAEIKVNIDVEEAVDGCCFE